MPSRVIREGWLESEAIDKLDAPAERFFLRLCLRADDYGRYHANPVLLKSNLFPLREDVRSTDSPRWLAACESAGLVRCYSVAGKRFLEIVNFKQRMRVSVSKFPAPPESDGQTTVTCPPNDSNPPPESESEAESDNEAETEAEGRAAAPTLPFSSPAFLKAWGLFAQHRRELKKKLTPTASAMALKELARMGEDRAIKCIEHTVAKGWQGLREPDQRGNQQGGVLEPRLNAF